MQRGATSTVRVLAGMRRRMVVLGFVYGFVLLVIAGILYVSGAALIGFLAQRFVPGLQDLPVLPAMMALIGTLLLIVDTYYLTLRSGRLRQSLRGVQIQAEGWIQPQDAQNAFSPEAVKQVTIGFVRGYVGGFLVGTVIFDCLYAASASWGLSRLLPEYPLFDGDPEAGFLQHVLFWLAIPFDLILLDAPSLFGLSPTELQPDPGAFGFLVAIFVFKTFVVASVVRMAIAAFTFNPDEGSDSVTNTEPAMQAG